MKERTLSSVGWIEVEIRGTPMNRIRVKTALALMLAVPVVSACNSTLGKSEAYQLGYQAGSAYAELADQAEIANSWDPEASLAPDDIRGSAKSWCEVEWMGQGLRLQIENTAQNESDFMSGCVDGFTTDG